MRIKSMFAGAVLALGVAAFAPSTAQAQVGFVVQGSYGFDVEALGVGGGVNLGLGSLTEKQGIRLEATFDYFLADDPLTFWEINGNLLKDIPSVKNLYVGAGINYANSSFDSAFCGTLSIAAAATSASTSSAATSWAAARRLRSCRPASPSVAPSSST